MQLHELKPAPGSRKSKRIVGRGEGSTLGQTCGKGQKGQTCRSGDTVMTGFEGGQTPLMRRLPKRGFRHSSKIFYAPIHLHDLEKIFEEGAEINSDRLVEKGLLKSKDVPFKVLAGLKITKALKIVAPRFSKPAEEAIKKAGGTASSIKTKA